MSIYKRILVATDFSDINLVAAKRAARLAKQNSCELILLHVIEHFPLDDGPLASVFQFNPDPSNAMAERAHARLDELESELGYDKTTKEFRITPKSARHEILRFAGVHGVDLIVVAPHAQGIIGMLGSTATGVINSANCDVLAVREPEKAS